MQLGPHEFFCLEYRERVAQHHFVDLHDVLLRLQERDDEQVAHRDEFAVISVHDDLGKLTEAHDVAQIGWFHGERGRKVLDLHLLLAHQKRDELCFGEIIRRVLYLIYILKEVLIHELILSQEVGRDYTTQI